MTLDFFDTSDYNYCSLNKGAIAPQSQRAIVDTVIATCAITGPLLDVCCGGAWLPIRLLMSPTPPLSVTLSDISPNQLFIAAKNITHYLPDFSCYPHLVCSDISRLPFRRASFSIITCTCAIHLLRPPQIEAAALEFNRITTTDGRLVIVTFDQRDIGQSICDKYIDGYADIDRTRYYRISDLQCLLSQYGWDNCLVFRHCSTYTYSSFAHAEAIFAERAYSTFALLEQQIGRDALNERITKGLRRLRADFAGGSIGFEQVSTIMVLGR